MANSRTYFVRLDGDHPDPLYVSIARNPQVYCAIRKDTLVQVWTWTLADLDSEALMGTFLNSGRAATVGDLRAGRARDISFQTSQAYWTARDTEDSDDCFLHVVYSETQDLFRTCLADSSLTVRAHADQFRDVLNSISGPVYGICIEDVRDKSATYAAPDTQIIVSAALFKILNPQASVSDQDTQYVVSHKTLTDWKPT